jgi:hypothetical protein
MSVHLPAIARTFDSTPDRKQWTISGLTFESLSLALLKVEYAVRGEFAT